MAGPAALPRLPLHACPLPPTTHHEAPPTLRLAPCGAPPPPNPNPTPPRNPRSSVPPYMVLNRCKDVIIRVKQAQWAGRPQVSSSGPEGGAGQRVPVRGQLHMSFDASRVYHCMRMQW